jgi:hypothetical protein
MGKFTLRQVAIFSVAYWGIFSWLSLLIGHTQFFHYLIPTFISLLVVLLLVYGRGLIDVWENRKNLNSSHMLILGLVLSGIGVLFRMIRLYITGVEYEHIDLEFWLFNIGMGVGIWGFTFLWAAAGVAVKTFNASTLAVIFLVIFSILLYADLANVPLVHFN